jgi:3-phosphoshikimate 1-carboxyvinyltransferase
MRIRPATGIRGRVKVPGDKSISHRAAIIASLAEGPSRVRNYSTSQDCANTVACLRSLGVSIEQNGHELSIVGSGTAGLRQPAADLDCGNSGSTMRMLAGVLASQNFAAVLTGDASLRARPMNRIMEPLALMGAKVAANDGRPPLRITGSALLQSISYELPVASAQVKSCILLAGLKARGRTEVIETLGPTRDHTERLLRWFGVPVISSGSAITLNGPVRFPGREVVVPGDISSAAFLIAAAALLPTSDLVVEEVGLNPTRSSVVTFLQSLGLSIECAEQRNVCGEPLGNVQVRGGEARQPGRRLAGQAIAQLIDELPLLAVVGTQVSGGLEIRDAKELRFKETDRISATVVNLRAMGAEVEEYEDGFAVSGPVSLRGASVRTFGDHRIAMAFTVAGLIASSESELDDAGCVEVSFPEFFDLLDSVVMR